MYIVKNNSKVYVAILLQEREKREPMNNILNTLLYTVIYKF